MPTQLAPVTSLTDAPPSASPDSGRLSRQERRRQVVAAAIPVVAASGFAAVTTDQVARAAGVSQPYVVRMFGGKAGLLEAVFETATQRVLTALGQVPPGPNAKEAMGDAYVDLVSDRDLLLVMLHGFAAGADPAIGGVARRTLDAVSSLFIERTGGSLEEATNFLAHGMLINVMLAVGAWDHADDNPELAKIAEAFTPCVP